MSDQKVIPVELVKVMETDVPLLEMEERVPLQDCTTLQVLEGGIYNQVDTKHGKG